MFCCQRKVSVCGIQTFCWRGIFQLKITLPVEVHGRMLAVLSMVPCGPTVITGQIPTLFVIGTVAASQQSLGMMDPRCPSHEVLHWWHSNRGLPGQDVVPSHAAVGGVHDGEGGAIAAAAHGAEGQEQEGEHGGPGEECWK